MTKTKPEAFFQLTIWCLNAAVFFILSAGFAKAELASGKAEFDENFVEDMRGYVDNLPSPGPFTGKKEADLEEIMPFIYPPLTVFDLSVGKEQERNYHRGTEINLKGTLGLSFQTREKLDKNIKDSCRSKGINPGSETCMLPEIYFPEFADLGVFVQVWRKDESDESDKGDYLMDEFYAAKDLTLNENERQEFNINWKVPRDLKEGKYYFSLYVNSGKRYNLSGFPTQAFSSGLDYGFNVQGEGENGIELDKNNITIDKSPFIYRQPAPEIKTSESGIKVEIPVVNLNEAEQTVKLNYTLFGWSQEDYGDVIDAGEEYRNLEPGQISIYTVNIKPADTDSVQNLKITANTGNSKSASNIRLLVKDKNRGLFRFLGLASPETRRDTALPIFCIRNASYFGYFNGKVKLTFTGQNGKPVIWEKEGQMLAGNDKCFVVRDSNLKFKKDTCLKIKGEIFDDRGRTVDEREANYSCQPTEEKSRGNISGISREYFEDIKKSKKSLIALVLIIIGLVAGSLIFITRKKQSYGKFQ